MGKVEHDEEGRGDEGGRKERPRGDERREAAASQPKMFSPHCCGIGVSSQQLKKQTHAKQLNTLSLYHTRNRVSKNQSPNLGGQARRRGCVVTLHVCQTLLNFVTAERSSAACAHAIFADCGKNVSLIIARTF